MYYMHNLLTFHEKRLDQELALKYLKQQAIKDLKERDLQWKIRSTLLPPITFLQTEITLISVQSLNLLLTSENHEP